MYHINKSDIIDAALAIVRRTGIRSLTIRAVAQELEVPTRVITNHFSSMTDLEFAVTDMAQAIFNADVDIALRHDQAFRQAGVQYIQFAMREPMLFQLLFMTKRGEPQNFTTALPAISIHYDRVIGSIQKEYHLERPEAERVHLNMWLYVHGIASLVATGICQFKPTEVATLLRESFVGLVSTIGV